MSITLSANHDSTHEGIQKTLHRVRADLYWRAMKTTITTYVIACQVYQRNKAEHLSPAGLLHPLALPTQILQVCTFYSCGTPIYNILSGTNFLNYIVCLHGIPESIISDRDARCNYDALWVVVLKTGFSALQSTPIRVLYGRDPPRLLSYTPVSTRAEAIDQVLMDCYQVLQNIIYRLLLAQVRMKDFYDKEHRDVSYEVGDFVWLRLQSWRMGPVAYQLQLPATGKLYDLFHLWCYEPDWLMTSGRFLSIGQLPNQPQLLHGNSWTTSSRSTHLMSWKTCSFSMWGRY
ncbi:uncharacterized protein [Aristolochia californica]|uniref:uncharacterized protein n=1 Tax=Aristolochia californica TaxID=171875 RepID=UPI0035D70FB4